MRQVEDLSQRTGLRRACEVLGVARATVYRHRRPTPIKAPRRPHRPPRALCLVEQEVLAVLHSERFVDQAQTGDVDAERPGQAHQRGLQAGPRGGEIGDQRQVQHALAPEHGDRTLGEVHRANWPVWQVGEHSLATKAPAKKLPQLRDSCAVDLAGSPGPGKISQMCRVTLST